MMESALILKIRKQGTWTNRFHDGYIKLTEKTRCWLAATLIANYLSLFCFKIEVQWFFASALKECHLL